MQFFTATFGVHGCQGNLITNEDRIYAGIDRKEVYRRASEHADESGGKMRLRRIADAAGLTNDQMQAAISRRDFDLLRSIEFLAGNGAAWIKAILKASEMLNDDERKERIDRARASIRKAAELVDALDVAAEARDLGVAA